MIDKIVSVIRRVLNNPTLEINENSTPNDVDGWDSLHHVMIISEIEKQFGVSFDFMELIEIQSVGDLYNAVKSKI